MRQTSQADRSEYQQHPISHRIDKTQDEMGGHETLVPMSGAKSGQSESAIDHTDGAYPDSGTMRTLDPGLHVVARKDDDAMADRFEQNAEEA